MNIATGEVLYDTRQRHTAKDVLAFFKLIDLHVPKDLDIHVILDNLSAQSAPEVSEWLADPRWARWHLHFTPTSSSWLDLVERWCKKLTDRMLRRGVLCSVAALIDAIELWERRPQALRLARRSRQDHRESPPRTGRAHRSQIRDAAL